MIATITFLFQVIKEELKKLGYYGVDGRRVVDPVPTKIEYSKKIRWYQIGNSRYHAPLHYYKTIFLFDLHYDLKQPQLSVYVNEERFNEQQARDLIHNINQKLREVDVTNFLIGQIYMDVVPSDSISCSMFGCPPKKR